MRPEASTTWMPESTQRRGQARAGLHGLAVAVRRDDGAVDVEGDELHAHRAHTMRSMPARSFTNQGSVPASRRMPDTAWAWPKPTSRASKRGRTRAAQS